jgi:hypothetical protein
MRVMSITWQNWEDIEEYFQYFLLADNDYIYSWFKHTWEFFGCNLLEDFFVLEGFQDDDAVFWLLSIYDLFLDYVQILEYIETDEKQIEEAALLIWEKDTWTYSVSCYLRHVLDGNIVENDMMFVENYKQDKVWTFFKDESASGNFTNIILSRQIQKRRQYIINFLVKYFNGNAINILKFFTGHFFRYQASGYVEEINQAKREYTILINLCQNGEIINLLSIAEIEKLYEGNVRRIDSKYPVYIENIEDEIFGDPLYDRLTLLRKVYNWINSGMIK